MISKLPDRMKKPLTAVNNSLNGKVSTREIFYEQHCYVMPT